MSGALSSFYEMLNWAKTRLPKGSFGRNVLVVMSGTTLAQGINILITPFLTRIFTPDEYGIYYALLSIYNILVTIAAAKYEMAIMMPEKDEDAIQLFSLSIVILTAFSGVYTVFVLFFRSEMAAGLNNPGTEKWMLISPLMVFIGSLYSSLNYWNSRRKKFGRLSVNRVMRMSLSSGFNIVLGAVFKLKEFGLIGGWLIGQGLTTIQFAWQIVNEDMALIRKSTWMGMKKLAIQFQHYPKYMVVSGLIETASAQFPSLIISNVFGASVLGLFGFAFNVIALPMTLIAESLRDVFWQAASHDFVTKGSCRPIFLSTVKKLFLLTLVPSIVLLISSPVLFPLVFGEKWRQAGVYGQILAIVFFFRIISSPVGSIIYIAGKQKIAFVVQASVFLVSSTLMYFVSVQTQNPSFAVLVYTLVYSIKYIVEFFLSYRFSENPSYNL